MSFTVQLGKDVTITGVDNGRTATFTNTASEIDVTKFGDSARKFRKALIEQTVEVECVDDPDVEAGDTFTISGSNTGNHTFICTSVAEADPLDGITTFTVSGVRTTSA
jgi:predicted TIM-barrel enzyme